MCIFVMKYIEGYQIMWRYPASVAKMLFRKEKDDWRKGEGKIGELG